MPSRSSCRRKSSVLVSWTVEPFGVMRSSFWVDAHFGPVARRIAPGLLSVMLAIGDSVYVLSVHSGAQVWRLIDFGDVDADFLPDLLTHLRLPVRVGKPLR